MKRALLWVGLVAVVVVVALVMVCREPDDLHILYLDGWRCLEASDGQAICERTKEKAHAESMAWI